MPILGYGEDALTWHALTAGIADVFRQLGDSTDPADSVCFFRPSFGRRSSRPGRSSRSLFGEFDAIIGTARAVYLFEAKWSGSGEAAGSDLELRPEQRRRHVAFRTYLEEWRRAPDASWQAFADRVRPILIERTQGLVPPSAGTILARNLEYVLRRLAGCGADIIDVLLFSQLSAARGAPTRCGDFCIVTHVAGPEAGSGFIRLLE